MDSSFGMVWWWSTIESRPYQRMAAIVQVLSELNLPSLLPLASCAPVCGVAITTKQRTDYKRKNISQYLGKFPLSVLNIWQFLCIVRINSFDFKTFISSFSSLSVFEFILYVWICVGFQFSFLLICRHFYRSVFHLSDVILSAYSRLLLIFLATIDREPISTKLIIYCYEWKECYKKANTDFSHSNIKTDYSYALRMAVERVLDNSNHWNSLTTFKPYAKKMCLKYEQLDAFYAMHVLLHPLLLESILQVVECFHNNNLKKRTFELARCYKIIE